MERPSVKKVCWGGKKIERMLFASSRNFVQRPIPHSGPTSGSFNGRVERGGGEKGKGNKPFIKSTSAQGAHRKETL